MILLLDNYDSFTYNLVQALGALGARVRVIRNDRTTPRAVERARPERIVLSPGPGRPRGAGISLALLRRMAGRVPILGVCLGHQCIAEAFGGRVVPARRLMHGKVSRVRHDRRGLFRGLPTTFVAARYHSLAVDADGLPPGFSITARAEDGEVMGLRHERLRLEGVQFHPESFLTPLGERVLGNFLEVPA